MIIIGHRGARGLAPENTLAGLKEALAQKVDIVEFDLRVTKDGMVVLNHDPGIDSKVIAASTYPQLKLLKPDLTSFEEALKLLRGKAGLYIEIKPGVITEPIVKIIKKQKPDINATYLASFSQPILLAIHRQLPAYSTLVIERWSGLRARRRAKEIGTKNICMDHHWLWFGFVKSMARNGYTLYAYTLNDPAKTKRWAKYGLAGVVTDYPDRFKR